MNRGEVYEWTALPLGQKPDSVIAKENGLNRRAVCAARNKLGIPPFVGFILSQEGEPLRSIEEAKYDAVLHWKGEAHTHQVPVPGSRYVADFRLASGTFVEIVGMLSFKRYAQKFRLKHEAYDRMALPVVFIEPGSVEYLFKSCPVAIKVRTRICVRCGKTGHDFVRGMCRSPCAMNAWRERRSTTVICGQCGVGFQRVAGSSTKFCCRQCYWKSLEHAWPSWNELDKS